MSNETARHGDPIAPDEQVERKDNSGPRSMIERDTRPLRIRPAPEVVNDADRSQRSEAAPQDRSDKVARLGTDVAKSVSSQGEQKPTQGGIRQAIMRRKRQINAITHFLSKIVDALLDLQAELSLVDVDTD